MSPILAHARACLIQAGRRPVALLLALAGPSLLIPSSVASVALPLPLLLLASGAVGGLGDTLLKGLLVRTERFPRQADGPPAMPTLPLSPRQRALGEALAAAPILAVGAAVALVVERTLATDFVAEMARVGALPHAAAAVAVLLAPAVLGASLQAGRGALPQVFGVATPGLVVVAAWRLGLVPGPLSLVTLALATGALLLAVGPLPRLQLRWRPLAGGPRARRARPAPAALRADLGQGLLRAHLQALPMASVALLPYVLTGGHADLERSFYVAIAVASVALGAAFMPLGRTPLGTGAGAPGPWATLPLPRHQVARVLYLHAALCLVLLPIGYVAVGLATGMVGSFVVPVLVLLGLPLAAPIAAALTGWWLGSWRRSAVAGVAGLLVSWLTPQALAADSFLPLGGVVVASLLAGLLPVAGLLRPLRLAPA